MSETSGNIPFEQAISASDASQPKPVLWKKCLQSSIGISLVVVVLTALILWLVNPPIVHRKRESDIEKRAPDPVKILVWSLIAGVVTLGGPFVYKWIGVQKPPK
jgi:cytochrome b561